MPKTQLRKQYLKRWQSWLEEPQSAVSRQQITEQLASFLQSQSGCWGLYRPLQKAHPDELDLTILERTCEHLQWGYPKLQTSSSGQEMDFFAADQGFSISPWGLPEPITSPDSKAMRLQGVIVPGIAFDRRGFRLGRGKGYYDVYLARAKNIQAIGVVPVSFLVTELPQDKWDQKMNWLACEESVFATSAK